MVEARFETMTSSATDTADSATAPLDARSSASRFGRAGIVAAASLALLALVVLSGCLGAPRATDDDGAGAERQGAAADAATDPATDGSDGAGNATPASGAALCNPGRRASLDGADGAGTVSLTVEEPVEHAGRTLCHAELSFDPPRSAGLGFGIATIEVFTDADGSYQEQYYRDATGSIRLAVRDADGSTTRLADPEDGDTVPLPPDRWEATP